MTKNMLKSFQEVIKFWFDNLCLDAASHKHIVQNGRIMFRDASEIAGNLPSLQAKFI